MSTHVNDFAAAVAVHQASEPGSRTASFDGSAVDLVSSDGDCFAIQQVGAFAEGNTWTGRVEQSADGSSWSAISGAAFAAVTAENDLQVIRFRRSARYVRYSATATGGTVDAALAVLIGEPRKTF